MNREDFPMLDKKIIYLDNGATTLKPQKVIDKMTEYYTSYSANAHRGDYSISQRVNNECDNTRELVKKFINANSVKEIVFTSGATQSLNMIASGFFYNYLESNDEIILTKSEHASNIMPWFRIAKEKKVKIKFLNLDENYEVTVDSFKEAITPNTRVISIAGITNVLGDVRPLKEIIEIAHNNNILVVVDGAQSVPHIKTDVRKLGVDFLAFSAHKMCGPTGIGVLYAKEELMEKIEPQNVGGGMNESFDSVEEMSYKSLPARLEGGTPNLAGIIGLGAAIEYINNVGLSKIRKHEIELGKYLFNELSKIKHILLINKKPSNNIAFNVNGIFAQDVAVYLNKYNICVRAGNHCAKILKNEIGINNTIRVSLYFYNTKEEIDKLIKLLKDKNKILDEML